MYVTTSNTHDVAKVNSHMLGQIVYKYTVHMQHTRHTLQTRENGEKRGKTWANKRKNVGKHENTGRNVDNVENVRKHGQNTWKNVVNEWQIKFTCTWHTTCSICMANILYSTRSQNKLQTTSELYSSHCN